MAASSSTSIFFSIRTEEDAIQDRQQQSLSLSNQSSKYGKRRLHESLGLRGNVVALSPERLIASQGHRGFQREQNLQLHLRVHKTGGMLVKRDPNVCMPFKKVYVCPVRGCAHHYPNKAFGDITGIKKHYFRKHCSEKRFRCKTCYSSYTAKDDIKAHSMNCRARSFLKNDSWKSNKTGREALDEIFDEDIIGMEDYFTRALQIGDIHMNEAGFGDNGGIGEKSMN